MALELNKLTQAVNELGRHAAERLSEAEAQAPTARAALNAIGPADEVLQAKVRAALRLRWAGAIPTAEPVNAAYPAPPHPARLNVLAADGSQIYPDRHGVALYYLINTGSLIFRHGLAEPPSTFSRPEVFFEDADLYEDGGGPVASARIDAERDVRELGELARLALAEGNETPSVALVDNGLLLYFALQTPDRELVEEMVGRYLTHLDELRASGAAVAGVVDRPRAASVVRLLRLAGLEMHEINENEVRQLGPFQRLTDAAVFANLQAGERSALFMHASPENQLRYRERGQAVHFFYLNAGRAGRPSLLRVEVPQWVADDPAQLERVHAALLEQCRVTDGYPYVLMRAHELAVVTQAERREFDQMVAGALLRRGMNPSISHKAQGKAWTGAARRRYP